MFADNWFPIQVEQMEKVGRPVTIELFEAVIERENRASTELAEVQTRLLRLLRILQRRRAGMHRHSINGVTGL
jgi:hypothetical protein